MSFGVSFPCYKCPQEMECVDRVPLNVGICNTIYGIHMNPNHSKHGGSGHINVTCQKRDQLEKAIEAEKQDGGIANV